jgi:hypothetical protein
MSGAETLIIDEWLTESLAGITGVTGVYEGLAPVDAPYPFIVFQYQSSYDATGMGPSARIMIDADYIVRVITESASFADMETIAEAIDTAIEGQSGSVTGGVVLGVARKEQYRDVEQYQNQTIRHLGGRYRIVAQGL